MAKKQKNLSEYVIAKVRMFTAVIFGILSLFILLLAFHFNFEQQSLYTPVMTYEDGKPEMMIFKDYRTETLGLIQRAMASCVGVSGCDEVEHRFECVSQATNQSELLGCH